MQQRRVPLAVSPAQTTRRRITVKVMLAMLITTYATLHLILFAASADAWNKARHESCEVAGLNCSFTLMAHHGIVAFVALVCFVTTAVMAVGALPRANELPLNPLYFFRAVLFTIFLLLPVVCIGWSNLRPVVDFSFSTDGQHAGDEIPLAERRPLSGIGGAFFLGVHEMRSANVMAHITLIFAALVAGVAAALAPPSVVCLDDPRDTPAC
ncbi:hypothetical protein DCS_02591 [Drechmeria coniospora]|uniref:Uncharacterized protein n=1 Tax=Drechmeria coniospora TaxID=98403 RepID=A0A151GWG8_DRECN|nr:hypothetical protein DCS_02591 [Drechmeria coniospora]KYK61449.1 hypothetical protein DCS_02591 [Drechmeria coniospora]ODA81212.1 hypothetical protein RJ55_04176 [Drechmeria coniospora]